MFLFLDNNLKVFSNSGKLMYTIDKFPNIDFEDISNMFCHYINCENYQECLEMIIITNTYEIHLFHMKFDSLHIPKNYIPYNFSRKITYLFFK